jgi:hypothetical protein
MYPWEKPKPLNYIEFMDTHVRVSVTINGQLKGSFAIVDEGIDMNAYTVMPDGISLMLKVEGHPRTTDQRMTITELVSYVLTNYK